MKSRRCRHFEGAGKLVLLVCDVAQGLLERGDLAEPLLGVGVFQSLAGVLAQGFQAVSLVGV